MKTVNMSMVRGDSALLSGTITPKGDTSLATPVTELRMQLRLRPNHASFLTEKTIGDGVFIVSQAAELIEFAIQIAPEDTEDVLESEVFYDLELTESDGFRSTPVGGRIDLQPDVTR